MKTTTRQLLLATGLCLSISLCAFGQPPDEGIERCNAGAPPQAPGHDNPMHGPATAIPPGLMPLPGLTTPPFLHGIDLSEVQQDKVFALLLAAAPALREQEKLEHKSDKELHALLASSDFDEARIKTLAETHAHAMAQTLVLRARSMHQILAVLTPEQRAEVDAMRMKFEAHQGLRAQIEEMHSKGRSSNSPNKE